jgi:type I restriction-modification system DNA methylase subunit
MSRNEEATSILQWLLPQLECVDIPIVNVKVDATTRRTKPLRGDLWISRKPFNSRHFEEEIIALIEAKPAHIIPGSSQWNDAVQQGKAKAKKQGLPFFIVTNTQGHWNYYRTSDTQPVQLDGEEIRRPLGIKDLEVLVTQISDTVINAVRAVALPSRSYSRKEFQDALWQLKNIYRNCAIDNSDKMIHTTITFVMLKYISEQESLRRTLPKTVLLWDDWCLDHMDRDICVTIKDIKKCDDYRDVANELEIVSELGAEHCRNIREELNRFQFSGCNFDLYGAVYESFADTKMKRDFGQYYTSRHITAALSELLLRGEMRLPNYDLTVCDPACGTGGFLTEAYRVLLRNCTAKGSLTDHTLKKLKEETFYGYDIKEKNISLARINMCLAGDGHTNIKQTEDSLITLPTDAYDYILTNVPYGQYKGSAGDGFTFCNKRRYETLFVEKCVRALRTRGRAVIIVPDGILESPSLENFRINLLNEALVEAVVSLHPYVFRPYTSEKTYALFLEKLPPKERGRRNPEPVFMYILENDGFQKGDKRYPIRENDIPDLLQNYRGRARAPHSFVQSHQINPSNFHNLLPEFYLNYYEHDYSSVNAQTYQKFIEQVERINVGLKGLFNE